LVAKYWSLAVLSNEHVFSEPGLIEIANGGCGDIPPSSPPKSEQPERAPSQLESSFDLKNHPNPEEDDTRRTPARASVRVRAPPGGQSSGGFW